MKRNRASQAALPECLESPSGSSFGSLETLGVAHPTEREQRNTGEDRCGKIQGKKEKK